MTKKPTIPTIKSLSEKVKELKDTLQELQSAIDKSTAPLEHGETSRFGTASYQGKKILIDTDWLKLFYKSRSSNGKNFLKDYFDIPDNLNLVYDIMLEYDKIKVKSRYKKIKNKFSKSYDTIVVNRTYADKFEGVKSSGKDTHNLIDIFDLISEYLLKQVQSLDSNQEELMNRLSEIEGDLYELRQSADRLLEYRIKRDKEFNKTLTIVTVLIIVGIIIYFLIV